MVRLGSSREIAARYFSSAALVLALWAKIERHRPMQDAAHGRDVNHCWRPDSLEPLGNKRFGTAYRGHLPSPCHSPVLNAVDPAYAAGQ